MRIVYQKRALNRLRHIAVWIERHDPHAAREVIERIRTAIESLTQFPERSRESVRAGVRELVVAKNALHRPLSRAGKPRRSVDHSAQQPTSAQAMNGRKHNA